MADILLDLKHRLHGVRQKERLVTWVGGLSRLCLWLLLLLAFFFVVDIWIVRSLDTLESYLVRAVLTAIVLGLMAWRAQVALYKPLGAGLDDDLMALRVENAHPELRHRLISTLQLSRAASEDRLVASTELVAALEEETLSFTRAIPFPQVVLFKPAWDWLWRALACLLLAVGLCFAFPRHASAFFMRLMFLQREYPTRVSIDKIICVNTAGEVVLDEDAVAARTAAGDKPALNPPVAAGDKVELRVYPAADAELPLMDEDRFAEGLLVYQYAAGPNAGVDHELTLVVPKELAKAAGELIRAGKGPASGAPEWAQFRSGLYWKASLDAVTDAFRASAELDDGRIGWRRFQVLSRPVVRTIKLTVAPPAYTPLDPEVHDKTGDVSAIQGSLVKIELQATQKLLHAQLQFTDVEPGQTLPQVVKLKADDTTQAETTWRGSFEVNRNTSYFIDLRATNGLTHPANPPMYQVVCKIDPLPTIQVKFPRADDTVTLKAKYPVQFAAHDNFGLKAVRLRYRVGDDENEKISTIDISPNLNGPLDYEGAFPLVMGLLAGSNGAVTEGEVVTFWLEAKDAASTDRPMGMTPGLAESAYTKNWARSNLYRLAIVSAAEKENELRQKVQEQLDLIQQQADTIKKDRNEKVVPAIENKPAP